MLQEAQTLDQLVLSRSGSSAERRWQLKAVWDYSPRKRETLQTGRGGETAGVRHWDSSDGAGELALK